MEPSEVFIIDQTQKASERHANQIDLTGWEDVIFLLEELFREEPIDEIG